MEYSVICIGTYHKTGTVWMQGIFQAAAEQLGIAFVGSDLSAYAEATAPVAAGIYFDDHCRVPTALQGSATRGFRLVRDPRDVVISGAHYHSKSTEPWLQRPIDRLGDRSYQQALIDQGDWLNRYAFEMEQTAAATTDHMVADISLESGSFRTVRYEDLICPDGGEACFSNLLEFLGFDASETDIVTGLYRQQSLAGGKSVDRRHARSGKSQQWKSVYSRALAQKFVDLHGDALLALGYEKNHRWLEALPEG